MNSLKNTLLISCIVFMLGACQKEENLNVQTPVGLGGDAAGATTIDKWIMDSLTTPYNIAAIYKWDPWNASLYKTLTPADESKVLPLFSALKRVWINPYNDETGSEAFMKKYSPKQFVLLGSVEYDFYSVTLGQAEGGNSIVFFDVNQNYDKNPVTSIKRVIHTAHHEFGHILHQTVMYPQDFKGTSSRLGLNGYTPTWFNVSEAAALADGYATSYSMSGPDDDFVEMIATMLSEGKSRFDEMKASTNATARAALQQKEDFVVSYFRQTWNIDFYRLQTRVQTAMNTLYPTAAPTELYGFGKTYTRASVNPLNTTLLPQPSAFISIYNSAKSGLAAVGNAGRVLDSFAVVQNSATTIQLTTYYRNAAGNPFQANFNYASTKDANNIYSYRYSSADGNGAVIATGVKPLVDYFSNNKFTIDWFATPAVSIYPRVKFTPQATPGTYFIARLLP
jgi:substrate import-associated zinc metallohydrolase lipoprotein